MPETSDRRMAEINARPLAYTNRRGETYYLHGGKTKGGKPRYFVAKVAGTGALARMPKGHEFSESVNGVVSVRRKTPELIPVADVEAVRRELARHPHLRYHTVEQRKDEIIIHEPQEPFTVEGLQRVRELFGWRTPSPTEAVAELPKEARYAPVMKFTVPAGALPGLYVAYRRFYRGEGGWHHLSIGVLAELIPLYVAAIGTDRFFELY